MLGTKRILTSFFVITLGAAWLLVAPTAASASSCNTAATGSWSNNCTVNEGEASHMVEVIQMIVAAQEVCTPYGVSIDGIFGPKTFNGVECFQRLNGIHVDGIVGPQTWGTLQSALYKCSAVNGWQYWSAHFPCPGTSGNPDPIRYWISTGSWYILSLISNTWQRINTSPPS